MVISFGIAGLLHEFLNPEKMRKSDIGSDGIAGVFWTTVSGMLIPICSCGTIPLGISLYYSGACLGPTLAFMTSSPMINPIAVILCWAAGKRNYHYLCHHRICSPYTNRYDC